MTSYTRGFFTLLAFVGLATAGLTADTSSASQINLILSDMDIMYDGGAQEIADTEAVAGGNLISAEADPIDSVVVELDGANIVTLTSSDDLRGDLLLTGVPAALPLGGGGLQPLVTSGFGFDWFSSTGDFLRLAIDRVDVLLSSTVFFFTAEAVVTDQSLPAGLEFDGVVSLSYTATLPAVQQGGQQTSLAISSGALTISGLSAVPEPATWALVLAAAGALALPLVKR